MHNEMLLKHWGPLAGLSEQELPSDDNITVHELGQFLSKAPRLEPSEYIVLFQYLNQTGRPCRVYTDIPHPKNALVLPPTAK
ncbi:hypothetical protein GYMLUDRAFT_132444, partial [Collybiopsis luxurians FD-317 M1]